MTKDNDGPAHTCGCSDHVQALRDHYEPLLMDIARLAFHITHAKDTLEFARRDLHEMVHVPAKLKDGLETVEKSLQILDEAVIACRDRSEFIWAPTEMSALKAEKVFGIPELLDSILTRSNAADLVGVAATNRTLAAGVAHAFSVPLQTPFWHTEFVKTGWDSIDHTIKDNPTNFCCYTADRTY